jgi:NAD(P)-dependent dehydrogenase (short-subunit alcohol dehydrogenase family)
MLQRPRTARKHGRGTRRIAFAAGPPFPWAMPPRTGTCIVVGASSGIGLAVARRLAIGGRKVAMLARREIELKAQAATTNDVVGRELAFAYPHDAADLDAVEPLFARIEQDLGPVDEVHFVAGVMPEVARDEFDLDKDRQQVQVNMLGCIAWGNAAARRFLARKAGCFVGVSSVAQDRGRVGKPGYHASKAGMDTYLDSLRNRLWRHGVQVTTIRPGFVDTPMTAGLKLKGAIAADKAAELILRARDRRKAIAYVPFKWRLIMLVIRHIPSFVFRKLSI